MNCAAVIPCLNEGHRIATVVQGVFAFLPQVIVVDDGSTDATSREAASAGADVIRHETNRGKGAAVQTGLRCAYDSGFEWALLMDGDGQHAANDIPKFLKEMPGKPPQGGTPSGARLVIGNRMTDPDSMPWLRRVVNRWMSVRLSRRLGICLPDTQCGFRLVHLPSWARLSFETSHFEVESEMLEAFVDAGCDVKFVPIQVIYKSERSKIAPVRDTLRWFRWWHGHSSRRRQRASVRGQATMQKLPNVPQAPSVGLARVASTDGESKAVSPLRSANALHMASGSSHAP